MNNLKDGELLQFSWLSMSLNNFSLRTNMSKSNQRQIMIKNSFVLFVYVFAVNAVGMLHQFWKQKQVNSGPIEIENLVVYECIPSPGPPFICYVTLPGGSCFGNYKVSELNLTT